MACVAGNAAFRPNAPTATSDATSSGELSAPPASPVPASSPAATPPPSVATISLLDRTGVRDRLQAALEQAQRDLAAPGIAASVLLDDGHQWTGVAGVADLATKRPLHVDTPFAIASISKTFLAAEVLTLVGDGRLSLDDPAVGLLPPDTVIDKAPLDPRITIRMLLDHTSGLADYLVDRRLSKAVEAAPTVAWTPVQALAYTGKALAAPGEGYHYSNTNYVLLGLIVERLTGRTLAEEYRARFFSPLGLRTATYQGVEVPVAELPTAYRYTSLRKSATPVDVTDGTDVRPFTAITTAAGAAGSIAASPSDLARWARDLYGGHVLSAAELQAMLDDARTTMTADPPYPYGLGVQVFDIDGHPSYGHSGRLVGARNAMRWFPDPGVAIAVSTTQSRFDVTPLVIQLLGIVAPDHVVPTPPLE